MDMKKNKNAFQYYAYRSLQWPPGGGVYPSMHWVGYIPACPGQADVCILAYTGQGGGGMCIPACTGRECVSRGCLPMGVSVWGCAQGVCVSGGCTQGVSDTPRLDTHTLGRHPSPWHPLYWCFDARCYRKCSRLKIVTFVQGHRFVAFKIKMKISKLWPTSKVSVRNTLCEFQGWGWGSVGRWEIKDLFDTSFKKKRLSCIKIYCKQNV